ncbi:hypothetical protein CBER1_10123 [Cercospora berteroae]|uniref:Uncharacterized protein n=1 Tax=Cercospora berteroae TaxID=357750 RepID=A0A2S6CKG5_9PEZI|nr:hypothetical protein CBER1_10123 [Cercospora berteroae]
MTTDESAIDSNGDHGNLDRSLQLRNNLESLPQELYNRIYDLTFAAEPAIRFYSSKKGLKTNGVLDILKDCSHHALAINEKLPPMFHVDRRSRDKFVKSYFGHVNTVFVFYGDDLGRLCIESSHLKLIPHVHYIPPHGPWTVSTELCQILSRNEGWPKDVVERIDVFQAVELPGMLDDYVEQASGTDIDDDEHSESADKLP